MKNCLVYILKSNDTGRFYIGQSNDINKRLKEHKRGRTSFGRRNIDISLVYKKVLRSKGEATKLECFLKRQKSRTFIERLIKGSINIPR